MENLFVLGSVIARIHEEDIMGVFALVGCIIAIIVLIRFFILCSDVSTIKKHLIQSKDFNAKFNFLMEIGEKEKAREILINRILSNHMIFSSQTDENDESKLKKCLEIYGDKLESVGIENPFEEDK